MTDPPPPHNAAQAGHSFYCPFDFRHHIDKWFCLEVPAEIPQRGEDHRGVGEQGQPAGQRGRGLAEGA
jgi:hypothetical protein